MTFLNSLLALGSLALTIPLLIHLLYRSRFTTIDWGAMHLLSSVIRTNQRRLQWTHWLLLLLRCSIPVLLALCLARPVLTGFRALAGDAPQSWILVIDDSRSMSARGGTAQQAAAGETRMERTKQQLISMVGQMSRHDEILLLPASEAGRFADTMGPQAAVQAIRQMRAESGPVDLASLFHAALDAADRASHPHRQIVVVSDFQSEMVDDSLLNSLDRLAAQRERSEPRPVVRLWNVGGDSGSLQNVSVDSVQTDSSAVIAGRPAEYSARVRNASDTAASGVPVHWSIDGNRVDSRQVTLPARSATTVRLRRPIDEPGVHEITVAAEIGDALPADNRRGLGVEVIREIGVLLVDGAPSDRALEGETDFLAIALSPFAFGKTQQQTDAVRTRVIRPRQIAEELQSNRWDVVVLANVPTVDMQDEQAVVHFVDRGGGLVIFDGDSLQPKSYNRDWNSDRSSLTLPARLGPRVGDPDVRDESAMQIGELTESFLPWSRLAGDDQRPLAGVDVFAYRKLEPIAVNSAPRPGSPPDAESPSDAESSSDAELPQRLSSGDATAGDRPPSTVLVRMANGDPLVVTARRGLGRVIQFAIPCDTAWSTLPLRPIFLPMMQQLVLHLAGAQTTATTMTRQPLVVAVDEFASSETDTGADSDAVEPSQPAAFRYEVETPQGDRRAIEPTADPPLRLIYHDTTTPGTYRVRQTELVEGSEVEAKTTIRVVEVPPVESQLRDVDPARLEAVADRLGATVHRDAASLRSADRIRRFGREVWRWVWGALLVVMIAEVCVAQFSVKRSRSGALA